MTYSHRFILPAAVVGSEWIVSVVSFTISVALESRAIGAPAFASVMKANHTTPAVTTQRTKAKITTRRLRADGDNITFPPKKAGRTIQIALSGGKNVT